MQQMTAPRIGSRSGARVGWELLRTLQEGVRSLEETASRILAAQVAGLIAVWSQLHAFESGLPRVLAWASLMLFVVSVGLLGVFLRPLRIVRFWDRALPAELFAAARRVSPAEEADAIGHISEMMRQQRNQLERAIRVAVPLGVSALTLITVAYILEKAFYD